MHSESFDEVLEKAFRDGDSTVLFNFFTEKADNEYLNFAINKIVDVIASYLSFLPENEAIVSNILSILMELNGVLELNFEHSLIIVKYVLFLVTEETSPLRIVKRAAHILNTYFSNPSIIDWLKNEESLEGSLQILGRKIPIIGDFECQILIFEALCRFITDDKDKIKWAHTWFPDDKTRSLFLNLNPPQFEMDCRKILNHINRNEPNPRTYAFVATSVYFGSFQLKKPYGEDFWIDFNYDSQSISFFCSEFGPNLSYDTSASWETLIISSDIVDYYSVQNKRITKSKELYISLKCACNDILPVGNPIYPEFQTNFIRISFWSFLDISQPLEVIFGKPVDLDNELNTESQGNNSTSQNCRKVSNSADVLSVQKNTNDGIDSRKVSVSNILEIPNEEEQFERNERRVSDSSHVIHLSDVNKEEQINYCDVLNNNVAGQKNDSFHKRKVSCSSLNFKESDDESDLLTSDFKNHINVKHVYSTIDKNSDVGKSNIEREIEYHQQHGIDEIDKFLSASNSVRKSSNASCNISLKSDDSQSVVDELTENNASESLLKDKEKYFFQTNNVTSKKVLSNTKSKEDLNVFQSKRQKTDKNDHIEGKKCNADFPDTSNKIKPLYKDSKTVKNEVLNTSLQTEKANVSLERNCDSQNCMKLESGIRKVSQKLSNEVEELENIVPENEEKSSKEDKNENGHLSDKKSACYEPKPKKLKKQHDSDSNYSGGRKFERKTNDIEKETISQPVSIKKPRRAALKAMRKNKTILEQRTPEKGYEICNFNQLSESSDHNFHKVEENISSPTKMVKKRRSKRKSVFTTDTETGSSEVSWFGKKRSYLFETPKKIYSHRKKNKQGTNYPHSRQRIYKSRNVISGSKKKQNSVSLLSELKSKNALSDLENYELLVERKSDYKSALYLNQDNLETNQNYKNNQVFSNIDARIHKTLNYNFEEEYDVQDLEDNVCFTSEASKQAEATNDDLRPSVTVTLNINKAEFKQTTSKKTKSKSSGFSSPEKNVSNVDLHIQSVSEQLSLSNSSKKRKSTDFSTFNKGVKKIKRNDNVTHCISLDTITNSEKSSNAVRNLTGNESLLAGSSTTNKLGYFSKISNNFFPNVPISLETRLKETPIVTKSNRHSLLYSKKKMSEKNVECDNYIPVKNILGTLSQESLSSLDNERCGKRLHMQRFLESLSGESHSPKDSIQYDNLKNDIVISEENSDEIKKHSNFEKDYVSEEKKMQELPSVKDSIHFKKRKKHFASINDPKISLHAFNTKNTSEKDSEKLPLLDNYSNYWSSEEKIDNYKKVCKTKEKNGPKPFAIFSLLEGEVDNLNRRLLGTLQKCSQDFGVKIASLRKNILGTASALISEDSELPQKDLKNLAITCKQNRIHVEKSLKKMLSVGQQYFEAEKRHDHKMKQLHKKAVKKYASRIKIAEKIATKALEEKVISKTNTFLKSIVKKIDHL